MCISRGDPEAELARYSAERLRAAERRTPTGERSSKRTFAPRVRRNWPSSALSGLLSEARDRFVVVDTAPSGHTLRLLDLTGSYHRQVMDGADRLHGRITTPLVRLQDPPAHAC